MKLSKSALASLILYGSIVLAAGWALELSGALDRQELQQINRLFEQRNWLQWNDVSLSRLNLSRLWNYHQAHEIPRTFWAWDYTLSWLVDTNHRQPSLPIVVFNHLPEDEPPVEAVSDHSWMEPLMSHPLHRSVVAGFVRTLAKAGASAILLDNDFPQYSPDDVDLAKAIHESANEELTGKKVPVFMVKSIYRHSSSTVGIAQVTTEPSGVLSQLQRLEPGVDVSEKYTGTGCLYADEDQVVRRCLLRTSSAGGMDSVVAKVLTATGRTVSTDAPDVMGIDFISPPGSGIIPVRSLSYLLDPDRQRSLLNPPADYRDVRVQGAVAIIGDGIVDQFNTPVTNQSAALLSGSEVLAQSIDTLNARSWIERLNVQESLLYLTLFAFVATWGGINAARSIASWMVGGKLTTRSRVTADAIALAGAVIGAGFLSACLFAYCRIIVPCVVPQVCTVLGFIACVLWEREQQRAAVAEERLSAAQKRHESEMKIQRAESGMREMLHDKARRREFARRINHDLKAPLTVLNWTLAKLGADGVQSQDAPSKVERLVRTADRLYELLEELTNTYDTESEVEPAIPGVCKLKPVLEACVSLGQSQAEMSEAAIELLPVAADAYAAMDALDLSRVIDNLVRNAFLHNAPGIKVAISWEQSGNYHLIKVADNGKGIAEPHLSRIFEAEYRVDMKDGKGTGLGLNIVKSFVEERGGYVSVVSSVGVGTTFILGVRSAEDAPPETASTPEAECSMKDRRSENASHIIS